MSLNKLAMKFIKVMRFKSKLFQQTVASNQMNLSKMLNDTSICNSTMDAYEIFLYFQFTFCIKLVNMNMNEYKMLFVRVTCMNGNRFHYKGNKSYLFFFVNVQDNKNYIYQMSKGTLARVTH